MVNYSGIWIKYILKTVNMIATMHLTDCFCLLIYHQYKILNKHKEQSPAMDRPVLEVQGHFLT